MENIVRHKQQRENKKLVENIRIRNTYDCEQKQESDWRPRQTSFLIG